MAHSSEVVTEDLPKEVLRKGAQQLWYSTVHLNSKEITLLAHSEISLSFRRKTSKSIARWLISLLIGQAPPGTSYTYEVHMVGPEEANSLDFKKIQEHHAKLWDFLHKNGKEPYEYKWSGYALDGLLGWLAGVKHINLMESKFVAPDDDEFFWLVFDETIKKKYLDQLKPTNFKQEELVYSFEHSVNNSELRVLKRWNRD